MKNILRLLAGGFAAAFFALAAQAANLAPGAYSAGTVKGDVSYKHPGAAQFMPLAAGVALPPGAVIKTGPNSSALIVFGSGSTTSIEANSQIEISKFVQDVFSGPVPVDSEPAISETEIKVIDGGVTSKVNKLKKGSSFVINTPVGAAGVRGTVFKVFFNKTSGKASIQVTEGRVQFTDAAGKGTMVEAGKKITAEFTKDDANNTTSIKLDVSDLTPEEIQQVMDVLGAAAAESGSPIKSVSQDAAGNIIIDTTQVSPN